MSMLPVITPDHLAHRTLEQDVLAYLEGSGCLSDCFAYHTSTKEAFKNALKYICTPPSLYYRGRADRLAIYPPKKLVFEWDAKTHSGFGYHNAAFEVLPFIHHMSKLWLGADCLYCYRDEKFPCGGGRTRILDCGFWVSRPPMISRICIPSVWWRDENKEMLDFFNRTFKTFLPGTRIDSVNVNRGSRDPFAVILENHHLSKLPHWKELIDYAIVSNVSPGW
jgi:hypothetical protein